ncbi:hypothetical protein [Sinimarinibacterium thermocellulolyticum]|uniref:Uncharacterized protein n=1 Tax=Sinimarinibacterium thermocellulolyticum TaxID=3170016 RepID=A0ABV2AEB2_9GAMM
MFGYAPDGVTVQVHGDGPFNQAWVHPAFSLEWMPPVSGFGTAPPSMFAFRKGDTVSTPRGSGEVLQGYRTGNNIQYEIYSAERGLFMADEKDMKRAPAEGQQR